MILNGFLSENVALEHFAFFPPRMLNTIIIFFNPRHSILLCKVGLPSEKAMAPHSSTLAWKISWMEEPGGLQSMGLLRVGRD